MLRFEREAVAALTTSTDARLRRAVEAYVDRRLRSMPDFLRIGVAIQTMALEGWSRVGHRVRRDDGSGLRTQLDRWEAGSPIGVVRSWVRLLRSLVTYAENELPEAVS